MTSQSDHTISFSKGGSEQIHSVSKAPGTEELAADDLHLLELDQSPSGTVMSMMDVGRHDGAVLFAGGCCEGGVGWAG